jgi:transcriptional regulator with XRE-family HTH domain
MRSAIMSKTIFSGAHTDLIEILMAARRRSGLTQAELGAKVEKDQAFISLIERSQRRVDVLEFILLARAMGEDPQRLFAEVVATVPSTFKI